MSVESISQALQVQGLTPAEKLCLIGIANHDGDGGAWPSISTLARYVGCTTRSAQRLVAILVAKGFVSVAINEGGGARTRRDRRPNLYHLHFTAAVDNSVETSVDNPSYGVTPMSPRNPDGVTFETPRGDIAVSPEPSLEPSIENTPSNKLDSCVDNFDVFWSVYPRKESKAKAKEEYLKALKVGFDPSEVQRGVEFWAKIWKDRQTELRFIPHAQTWIHQHRFLDAKGTPDVLARDDLLVFEDALRYGQLIAEGERTRGESENTEEFTTLVMGIRGASVGWVACAIGAYEGVHHGETITTS